jgi:predicted enzyme related to lactoylglutathione lyase
MANPVTWFEVTGKDGKKLQDFYSGVFGWTIDANNPMQYGIVDNEGRGIQGGIAGSADAPNGKVTFYIGVDDPQAYLNKVEANGGKTVPGMVVFAQFADPEGNVVGLVDAKGPPPA